MNNDLYEESFSAGFKDPDKGKLVLRQIQDKTNFIQQERAMAKRKADMLNKDYEETLKKDAKNAGKFLDKETRFKDHQLLFSEYAKTLLFSSYERSLANDVQYLAGISAGVSVKNNVQTVKPKIKTKQKEQPTPEQNQPDNDIDL